MCVCVCSNANPFHYYVLQVLSKADKALSVIYFGVMYRLGRPHYVWNEYLYRVLESNRVEWDDNDDERKGEGETWCRIIVCSS